MQFAPGPACAGAMFLDQPLAGPAQLQPRAVHEQMNRLGIPPSSSATRPWPGDLQGCCPAAQGGVVRDGEIEAKQVYDGADQTLGLAQRQAEHGPERQGCQDGERRIPGLSASGRAWLRLPG